MTYVDEIDQAEDNAALALQAEFEALNEKHRAELVEATQGFRWTVAEDRERLDLLRERQRLEYVELTARKNDLVAGNKAQIRREAKAAERGEEPPRRRIRRPDATPQVIPGLQKAETEEAEEHAPKPVKASRKPAPTNVCPVCNREIPPSGKRGRPRKVHDECKAAAKVEAASAPPKKLGRPRKIER